jgi:hypothetical protein
MSRSTGVEVTSSRVAVCSVEQAGRRTRILRFHEAPIAPEGGSWEERAGAALKAALDAVPGSRLRAAASIDAGEALLRELVLPFKSEEQVRKTVRYELESLIHNHAVEDLVTAWTKAGETDKATLLVAAAVPREAVARALALHQAAGADPVALDLDVAAVFSAFAHAGAIDTDAPHLVLYGTPRFAKILLVEERKPRSIRTLRYSLQDAGPGGLGARLDLLAREIGRFLLSGASTAAPAHLLLAGDLAAPGVAAELQRAAGIPVRDFDLLGALEADRGAVPPESAARLAASLGLALKAGGVDPLGLDFRQEEFRYARRFEGLRNSLQITLQLAVVLIAALGLHLWFKGKDFRRDAGTVRDHQRALYENATGETLADASGAFDRMRALFKQAQNAQGTDLPLKASAREAWRELYGGLLRFQQKYGDRTLGDGQLYLELDSLDISQNTVQGNESLTMTVRGRIRNLEFAGLLKQELRALDLYASADYVGTLSPVPDSGLYQFTLRAVKGGRSG